MVTRSGGAAGRWWVRARHRRTLVLVPCQLLHTLSVLSLPQELLVWTPSSLCEMNMARRSGGAAKTAMWVFHLGSHLCSWLLVRLWRCRRGGKIPLVVGYATRGSTGLWCRVLCVGSCACDWWKTEWMNLPDKWSPALQIRTVLLSVQALLSAPNPDDPLATDVAKHYKENEADAQRVSKEWTEKYAVA